MKRLTLFVLLLSVTFGFSQTKIWSKNMNSIIGQDYKTLGDTIVLEDQTITKTGSGYMLSKDNKASNEDYGIVICRSTKSIFYLFLKFQRIDSEKKEIILDILEIDRTYLTGNIMTEYCETKNGSDTEILALVKDTKDNPEFYTKVVKAWKANRKSEKFEKISKKKVKRCGNEGYGI